MNIFNVARHQYRNILRIFIYDGFMVFEFEVHTDII